MSERPRFSLVHQTRDGEFLVHRGETYAIIARLAAEWLAAWRRGRLTAGRGHCRAWAVGRFTWRLMGPPPDHARSWLQIRDEKGALS